MNISMITSIITSMIQHLYIQENQRDHQDDYMYDPLFIYIHEQQHDHQHDYMYDSAFIYI